LKEKECKVDEKWREVLHPITFATTDGLKHGRPAKEVSKQMGNMTAFRMILLLVRCRGEKIKEPMLEVC
jgi:hypothetical protein